MKIQKKHIIFLLSIMIVLVWSFSPNTDEVKDATAILLTKQAEFEAGSEIILDFEIIPPSPAHLILHSSFGTTEITSETGTFLFPDFVANKKGIIDYQLSLNTKELVSGQLKIKTNSRSPIDIASYVGPSSITAGEKDYTMQVLIPTDVYDNPLPDSTAIRIVHQFLDSEKEKNIVSKNMIGWSRIYSYQKSGRMLLSSKVGNQSSKEFSVEVFPDIPLDFEINGIRKHKYADGNQVTKLITSVLKDRYGNVVSDGTYVQFVIKDSSGFILQTQASTINGVATGKILHPDHSAVWQVQGYVPAIAKSNVITLDYRSIMDDIPISFSQDNRTIQIGPLLSFMEQLIPDGALVTLKLFRDKSLIEKIVKNSSEGIVTFDLAEDFYPKSGYDIEIEALGIKKIYKNIKLQ